jgi:hypothetical protein
MKICDQGARNVAAAILLYALRDIEQGSQRAFRWVRRSRWASDLCELAGLGHEDIRSLAQSRRQEAVRRGWSAIPDTVQVDPLAQPEVHA